MTVERACAILEQHRRPLGGLDGYLDIALQIEQARPLTAEEQEAVDVIWADFESGLRQIIATYREERSSHAVDRG